MRLCDLFTDRIRCIFPGILPVVDADNRRILIDELFDHIQHRSLKLLPNGKDSLIADAHKIILLDLLVIDHGIAHRIGHLTGLYRAKLLAHALCILLRCAVRNIVDERRDSLRDRLGRDHDDLFVLHKRGCLIGCENNILVIRKNKDILRVHFFDGV